MYSIPESLQVQNFIVPRQVKSWNDSGMGKTNHGVQGCRSPRRGLPGTHGWAAIRERRAPWLLQVHRPVRKMKRKENGLVESMAEILTT
jgi:hypothetical protein